MRKKYNAQNNRVYWVNKENISKEKIRILRSSKPRSLMVFTGISQEDQTPLVFVPRGVNWNASKYLDNILIPVVKTLNNGIYKNKYWIFQ